MLGKKLYLQPGICTTEQVSIKQRFIKIKLHFQCLWTSSGISYLVGLVEGISHRSAPCCYLMYIRRILPRPLLVRIHHVDLRDNMQRLKSCNRRPLR